MALKPISDADKEGFKRIPIAAQATKYEITFNAGGSITFSKDLTAYFVKCNDGNNKGLGVNISTKDGTDSKGKKKGKVILFEVILYAEGLEERLHMDGQTGQPLALKTNKQSGRFQLNAKGFYKNIGVPVLGKRWGHSAITLKDNGIWVELNKRSVSTKTKTKKAPEPDSKSTKAKTKTTSKAKTKTTSKAKSLDA